MDETRRHNLLYPLFTFCFFRINKAKIVLSVCFLIYSGIKNCPKIKVIQMPCKYSMIFSGIFEDFRHWKHCKRGKHQATREEGAPPSPPVRRAPLSRGPLVAPLHLCQHPHTSSSTQKKSPSSSSTSSSSFCCDFQSLSSKLHSQNCFGRLLLSMWLLRWSN